MGEQVVPEMPHLSTRLEKWLISKKLNHTCGPSSTLSKILENSAIHQESVCDNDAFDSLSLKTPDKSSAGNTSVFRLIPSCDENLAAEDVPVRKIKMESIDLEDELKRLSLTSDLIPTHQDFDQPILDLLSACGQMRPSNFIEAFSKFWYGLTDDLLCPSLGCLSSALDVILGMLCILLTLMKCDVVFLSH